MRGENEPKQSANTQHERVVNALNTLYNSIHRLNVYVESLDGKDEKMDSKPIEFHSFGDLWIKLPDNINKCSDFVNEVRTNLESLIRDGFIYDEDEEEDELR